MLPVLLTSANRYRLDSYMNFLFKLTAILATIIFLARLALSFVPFRSVWVFYKENTNHIEAFVPIDKEDQFQIIFKHSIHLTDVVEKYEVMDNDMIKQTEIVYEELDRKSVV